jgi:hypothetical protein
VLGDRSRNSAALAPPTYPARLAGFPISGCPGTGVDSPEDRGGFSPSRRLVKCPINRIYFPQYVNREELTPSTPSKLSSIAKTLATIMIKPGSTIFKP